MTLEHRLDLGALPAHIAAFLALRDTVSHTPQGGAAVFALALLLHVRDRALGLQALTAALDASHLTDGPSGLQGKQPSALVLRNLRDRVEKKPYIAASYFEGTSPGSAYALPAHLAVRVREQRGDVGASEAKVFVFSSGADTPRPMRLVKSPKGHWKATEWSSLEVGVRPPVGPSEPDI
jgi:hypothetical protein